MLRPSEPDSWACPEFHGDQTQEAQLLIEQDGRPIRFIHMHRERLCPRCVRRCECGRGGDLCVEHPAATGLKFSDQL